MVRKTSFQNYMDVLSSFSQRVGVPRHLLKRLHNFGFEMEERFDIPYDRVARVSSTSGGGGSGCARKHWRHLLSLITVLCFVCCALHCAS